MQSVQEIKNLVFNLGYQASARVFAQMTPIYPMITTPLSEAECAQFPLGTRWVGAVGLGDLEQRNPGERYASDTTREGYARQMAIRNYGKTHKMSMELIQAAGGMASYESKVVKFAEEVTRRALQKKEQIVANMYQKGTISAGDTAVFNQTYPGFEDANIGKIYDAKPFFAASGNAHPFKEMTAVSPRGINLTVSRTLTTDNLRLAEIDIDAHCGWDERGNRVPMTHRKLMVPKALGVTALTILNSTQVAENALNGENVLKNTYEVVVNPWLADSASSASWWTLNPEAVVVFDEATPRIRSWFDEETNSMCLACDVYFGAAPAEWRDAYCNNKAVS